MEMEEKVMKWMESLPYPAVALLPTKKGIHRNRLAKRLLPSLTQLKESLFACEQWDEEFLREIRLEDISYLVVALPETDGVRLLCFFENFLPLHEAFSRLIVGKMKDFFWTLLNEEEPFRNPGNFIHPDQVAARACSLRMHGDDYLRLLSVSEMRFSEEAKSCCLEGFFGHLQRALELRGIRIGCRFPEKSTVLSTGELLSFLVLNLVHFFRLFAGDQQIFLTATEEATGVRFSIEFTDEGDIASSLESLIRFGKGEEKSLLALPMFCVLRVCLEQGISWSVRQEGDVFSISFLLAKGDELPVLFLSDPAATEGSVLVQMTKWIFS
ncbi:MAG: hypothetical protein IJC26_06110 [Clostridia bacterium]|nr:hypothetical protein [Clostridia bacterium]